MFKTVCIYKTVGLIALFLKAACQVIKSLDRLSSLIDDV